MKKFTEKGEKMFDNAINVNSDKMMVDENIRPPRMYKDIYIAQKLEHEKRRLADMKYKYSISRPDDPLRVEMIEIIIKSNPRFNVVLKLV